MKDLILQLIGNEKINILFYLFLFRISLQWNLNNRTYLCPEYCSVSLYSLIRVTFNDMSLLTSKYSIDSCDLIALYPYSTYLQTRRLIYRE